MRRSTVLFAGFLCLAFFRPSVVRGQAEELPAELATPPAQPSVGPSATPKAEALSAPSALHKPGLLFMPYLGFSIPVGDVWQGYSGSFRVGAILGWQVAPRLSVNGEGDVDFMDADVDSSFFKPREHSFDLSFSPLVHLRDGQLVLGPKLGWFSNARSDQFVDARGSGLLVGLNLGIFVAIKSVTLGGLVGATARRFATFACTQVSTDANPSEDCGYHRINNETIGVSGALLF